jgi:hypothetical protein
VLLAKTAFLVTLTGRQTTTYSIDYVASRDCDINESGSGTQTIDFATQAPVVETVWRSPAPYMKLFAPGFTVNATANRNATYTSSLGPCSAAGVAMGGGGVPGTPPPPDCGTRQGTLNIELVNPSQQFNIGSGLLTPLVSDDGHVVVQNKIGDVNSWDGVGFDQHYALPGGGLGTLDQAYNNCPWRMTNYRSADPEWVGALRPITLRLSQRQLFDPRVTNIVIPIAVDTSFPQPGEASDNGLTGATRIRGKLTLVRYDPCTWTVTASTGGSTAAVPGRRGSGHAIGVGSQVTAGQNIIVSPGQTLTLTDGAETVTLGQGLYTLTTETNCRLKDYGPPSAVPPHVKIDNGTITGTVDRGDGSIVDMVINAGKTIINALAGDTGQQSGGSSGQGSHSVGAQDAGPFDFEVRVSYHKTTGRTSVCAIAGSFGVNGAVLPAGQCEIVK